MSFNAGIRETLKFFFFFKLQEKKKEKKKNRNKQNNSKKLRDRNIFKDSPMYSQFNLYETKQTELHRFYVE